MNISSSVPTFWNATVHGNVKKMPVLHYEVDVMKADSSLHIEYFPEKIVDVDNLTILADFERIPTTKNYSFGITAKDLPWNSKGGEVPSGLSLMGKNNWH